MVLHDFAQRQRGTIVDTTDAAVNYERFCRNSNKNDSDILPPGLYTFFLGPYHLDCNAFDFEKAIEGLTYIPGKQPTSYIQDRMGFSKIL